MQRLSDVKHIHNRFFLLDSAFRLSTIGRLYVFSCLPVAFVPRFARSLEFCGCAWATRVFLSPLLRDEKRLELVEGFYLLQVQGPARGSSPPVPSHHRQ